MHRLLCRSPWSALLCFGVSFISPGAGNAQAPLPVQTNSTIRVMAANITTGNNQRYEAPGLRIFKALKPDIVAVQEFNYASTNGAGTGTPAAIREMIDSAFGTDFVYFRESGAGYTIPNGIISRWPIRNSGTWDDVQVPDRGFAWAQIDIPGTNDLFIVSVHLHSSGGSSSRFTEASNLRSLIQSNFPAGAFIVVAGDLNTDNRNEAAVATLKTFLSDAAIPTDQSGDPDTNLSRAKPYDYVMPSYSLASHLTATAIGTNRFPSGLVFDSRTYPPLFDGGTVQTNDSRSVNMQHMAVVKDFQIRYAITNLVEVPAPKLTLVSPGVLHWAGVSQVSYTVQTNRSLNDWVTAGSATSMTTNYWFTNSVPAGDANFYRVISP